MSRHKSQSWSQVAYLLRGCLLFKRKEERGRRKPGHGAREKVNWKAPLLPLATDPEDSRCRDLRGGLEASRRPGSFAVGWGQNPHRGRSRAWLEWLLCTQNISLQKALVEVSSRKAAPSQARPVVSGLSPVSQDQANPPQAGL